MFYNWAHCTCITIKLPLFGCFVDTAWDLYVDPYLDIHFVPQKSAVGKLEHSGLLMLNSWDFCIQIWVWMRAQRPWPSLTTQSWSWKNPLNIRPFPLFSQECALWVQVRLRAPWQWTCCPGPWVEFWFSTVCHQIHFDSYWGRCHKPRNAKLSGGVGRKLGITAERISWAVASVNRQIDLLWEYACFPFYLLQTSFSLRKCFTVLGRWEWPLGIISSDCTSLHIFDFTCFPRRNRAGRGRL